MLDLLSKIGSASVENTHAGVARLRTATRQRDSWPVSTHLIIYGTGTLVPVLGIVGYLLINTATLQREQALRQAQAMASNISYRVDRELEKAISIGRTLATSRPLAQGDYAEFDDQAREVAQMVGAIIAFRDLTGQQRTNTTTARGQPLPVSNPQVLAVDRRVAELKRPVISDLLVGTVLNRHLVLADVPVFKGADVVGFINVALYPETLSQLIGQDLSDGWIAGLVGSDGRHIARTKDHDRLVGTSNPRFLSIVKGNEGTWEGQTDDSIRIAGAYYRSPLSGWITSVAVPEAELTLPLQRAFQWSIGLSVVAITLSLLLGWMLSQRIARPIRALSGYARGLVAGAPLGQTHFAIEEVAHVAEALRQTSLELSRQSVETARAQAAIRESEARYRAALSVGRIATWETNLATRERLWSPEGKILFGLTIPDLMGRVGDPDDEYRNALHPDDRHLMQHFHQLAEGQDGFAAEYRIRHADGTLLWVTGRGQVIERSASGKPIRLLSVVADITERKLAEDALKASEARFRMLAEAIPNIAWTATPDGIIDWHSPRWIEYTGSAPQLLTDQGWQGSIHPDDLEKTIRAWQSAITQRKTYELEHRLRGKDGAYSWFLSRAMPVTGAGDEVVAWVGTATNIDALKTTEANLARYVAVADAAHDGLISITPGGIIESWNAGAERLFGYKATEMLGRPTATLIPDELLAAHRDMIVAVQRGNTVGPIDVKRRHKDGHLVDVAISMTGVRDERGALMAIAKVAHDISARIEAERRQQLLNRELAHRVSNSFAVLQSVMRATLRSAPNLQAFGDTFTGRMQSMTAAQGLLTDREWRDAELTSLTEGQLAPHKGRIEMNGPRLELPAQFAVPLGLLLHELATNAVKYGALSVPQGQVALTWSLQTNGTGRQVEIIWREQGGPPVVEPTRRGFGSVLIEKGLQAANVNREFHSDGVICTIMMPLQD